MNKYTEGFNLIKELLGIYGGRGVIWIIIVIFILYIICVFSLSFLRSWEYSYKKEVDTKYMKAEKKEERINTFFKHKLECKKIMLSKSSKM